MNILKVQGDIDNVKLDAELLAALGAAGSPMKWWTVGEKGLHTVYYNDEVDVVVLQRVVDTHLVAAVKRDFNAPIDVQIAAIELSAPISHRSLREGFLIGAQQSVSVNVVIASIESKLNDIIAALNTLPGVTISPANVGRVPNTTLAGGMARLAQLDTIIVALRNQRQ